MKQPSLIFPLFLIIAGTLWFLNSMDWFPQTFAVIAGTLILSGFLLLLLDGINKQSIVVAPLLIYAGIALFLHNQYHYDTNPMFALGMILAGILKLTTHSDAIPNRKRQHTSTQNNK